MGIDVSAFFIQIFGFLHMNGKIWQYSRLSGDLCVVFGIF